MRARPSPGYDCARCLRALGVQRIHVRYPDGDEVLFVEHQIPRRNRCRLRWGLTQADATPRHSLSPAIRTPPKESSAVDLNTYVRTPLSDLHVDRLREIGTVVTFAPGERLVTFGTTNEAFYYILDGESAACDEVTDTRYGNAGLGPSQFTGEMSFLRGVAGRRSRQRWQSRR